MRKILIILTMLMVFACVVIADTIYLRDGSLIKGTFIGFENGSFIIETSRGDHDSYPVRYVSRVVLDHPDINPDSRGDRYPRRDAYREPVLDKTVDVPARQAWTDTGIDLERGVELKFATEGLIKIGERSAQPNGIHNNKDDRSRCPMPEEGLGAVIGKVQYRNGRDSAYFFIGSSKIMNVGEDQVGRLYIGINDSYIRDNSGSFSVKVSAERISSYPPESSRQRTQREKTVEVDAKEPWTDTGIELERNAWIDVTSEGRIKIGERSADPDGIYNNKDNTSRYPMPDKALGAVIAKVQYRNDQNSDYIFIGSRIQTNINTGRAGRLYIGINDDYLSDNRGSYHVTIRW